MDDAQWSLPLQVWKVPNKTGLNKIYRFVTIVCSYNYHYSGHYPSSCLVFKTRRFGDWILSPSSGGTYSNGKIERANYYLRSRGRD
jgi:hypothetical protein